MILLGMTSALQYLLFIFIVFSTPESVRAEFPVHIREGKKELNGTYKEPTIQKDLFRVGVAMTDSERNDYSDNFAAYAVKMVREKKGSQVSLEAARVLIALAFHLSPRNRKVIIVNHQLKDGLLPKALPVNYSEVVFSNLLVTRGLLLEKKGGVKNKLLARYFIDLAVMMNPRNEDAVFESEIRRIDEGALSWSLLTNGKNK